MALVIRLTPFGKKHQRTYRIRVADQRSPLRGRFVAELGSWDPQALQGRGRARINVSKSLHFLKQGVKPSETVRAIFRKVGLTASDEIQPNALPQPRKGRREPINLLVHTDEEITLPLVAVGKGAVRNLRDAEPPRRSEDMDVGLGAILDQSTQPAWRVVLRLPGEAQQDPTSGFSARLRAGNRLSLQDAGLSKKPVAQLVLWPSSGKSESSPLRVFLDVRTRHRAFVSLRWRSASTFLTATNALAGFVRSAAPAPEAHVTLEDEDEVAVEFELTPGPADRRHEAVMDLGSVSRAHLTADHVEGTVAVSQAPVEPLVLTVSLPAAGFLSSDHALRLILDLLRHTNTAASTEFDGLSNSLTALRDRLASELSST